MADNTNIIGTATTGGFAKVELKEFYEKNLYLALEKELALYNLCKVTNVPKNSGDTISWRFMKNLSSDGDFELKELEVPEGQKLTIVEMKATLKPYGAYVAFSDRVDDYAIDPVLTEATTLLGRQAGEVIEKKIMTAATSGAQVYYAGGAASRAAVTSTITAKDVLKIKAYFKKTGVKPLSGGKYVAIISPEMEMDLITEVNTEKYSFVEVGKYADPKGAYAGEIGEWLGIRWIVSSFIDENNGVQSAVFLGEDGLGAVVLSGSSNKPEIIYKAAGSAGTADPLNQKSSIAWKNKGFTARILRDEAVLRYECKPSVLLDSVFTEIDDTKRSGYSATADGTIAG